MNDISNHAQTYEQEKAISAVLKKEICDLVLKCEPRGYPLFSRGDEREKLIQDNHDSVVEKLDKFTLSKDGEWYVFAGFLGSDIRNNIRNIHYICMLIDISARYSANGVVTEMRPGL